MTNQIELTKAEVAVLLSYHADEMAKATTEKKVAKADEHLQRFGLLRRIYNDPKGGNV